MTLHPEWLSIGPPFSRRAAISAAHSFPRRHGCFLRALEPHSDTASFVLTRRPGHSLEVKRQAMRVFAATRQRVASKLAHFVNEVCTHLIELYAVADRHAQPTRSHGDKLTLSRVLTGARLVRAPSPKSSGTRARSSRQLDPISCFALRTRQRKAAGLGA